MLAFFNMSIGGQETVFSILIPLGCLRDFCALSSQYILLTALPPTIMLNFLLFSPHEGESLCFSYAERSSPLFVLKAQNPQDNLLNR